MHIMWTAHLANSPKEKKALEENILGSSVVLNRLLTLIEDKEKSLNNYSISSSIFQNPNWAFEQAYIIGRLKELSEIKQLLTFKDDHA